MNQDISTPPSFRLLYSRVDQLQQLRQQAVAVQLRVSLQKVTRSLLDVLPLVDVQLLHSLPQVYVKFVKWFLIVDIVNRRALFFLFVFTALLERVLVNVVLLAPLLELADAFPYQVAFPDAMDALIDILDGAHTLVARPPVAESETEVRGEGAFGAIFLELADFLGLGDGVGVGDLGKHLGPLLGSDVVHWVFRVLLLVLVLSDGGLEWVVLLVLLLLLQLLDVFLLLLIVGLEVVLLLALLQDLAVVLLGQFLCKLLGFLLLGLLLLLDLDGAGHVPLVLGVHLEGAEDFALLRLDLLLLGELHVVEGEVGEGCLDGGSLVLAEGTVFRLGESVQGEDEALQVVGGHFFFFFGRDHLPHLLQLLLLLIALAHLAFLHVAQVLQDLAAPLEGEFFFLLFQLLREVALDPLREQLVHLSLVDARLEHRHLWLLVPRFLPLARVSQSFLDLPPLRLRQRRVIQRLQSFHLLPPDLVLPLLLLMVQVPLVDVSPSVLRVDDLRRNRVDVRPRLHFLLLLLLLHLLVDRDLLLLPSQEVHLVLEELLSTPILVQLRVLLEIVVVHFRLECALLQLLLQVHLPLLLPLKLASLSELNQLLDSLFPLLDRPTLLLGLLLLLDSVLVPRSAWTYTFLGCVDSSLLENIEVGSLWSYRRTFLGFLELDPFGVLRMVKRTMYVVQVSWFTHIASHDKFIAILFNQLY